MTRLLSVLAASVAVSAVAAAPASALTPAQKITKLQKQVTQLQKDVKFLRSELAANYVGDECLAASTADVFQHTWIYVNRATASTTFPAAPTVNDRNGCTDIRVERQLPSTSTPPVATIFQKIIDWIG